MKGRVRTREGGWDEEIEGRELEREGEREIRNERGNKRWRKKGGKEEEKRR